MSTGPAGMSAAGAGAAVGVAPALDFLREALAAPFREGELRVITLSAPAGAPERLLAGTDDDAIFWDASSGPTAAGVGVAAVVTGSGEARFAEVRARAEALWARVESVAQPGTRPMTPRLFGGFAFIAALLPPHWASFGDARFVLPRLVYGPQDGGGRLAVVATEDDSSAGGADRLAAEAGGALRLVAGEPRDPATGEWDRHRPARTEPIEPIGPDQTHEWTTAIRSIQDRIAAGRAEKIVAARQRDLRVPGGADAAAVLRRLRAGTAAEARFAFRFGAATFLGATPERLISLRGRELRTEALAGSIDADRADRAEELLESVKDAAEHAYVVRALADALEPLCDRLEYPSEPRIQRLRHVLHLQTPFAGRLSAPAHVLDLVQRLHPTPAVGGTPTDEALAWIADEEAGSRGWYAAPVGWFDAAGDGEFVVALRSALLAGDRARLYAGAGIVRDSDAAAELAETEVKLRTMADALGWVP